LVRWFQTRGKRDDRTDAVATGQRVRARARENRPRKYRRHASECLGPARGIESTRCDYERTTVLCIDRQGNAGRCGDALDVCSAFNLETGAAMGDDGISHRGLMAIERQRGYGKMLSASMAKS
jgi:hypothetical protein